MFLSTKICIFLALCCTSMPPLIWAFCPPGCECRDDQLSVACNFTGLSAIPILLNPMLKTLTITNSNSLKLETFSIALYQELESLELSHNHISKIPAEFFGKLPKLKELNLQGNAIKQVDNGTFQGVKMLEKLDLSSNLLHSVDPSIFGESTNLSRLILEKNRISKVPNFSEGGLLGLVELDLSGNLISELMSSPFSSLAKLRTLDLSSNLISCMDKDAFSGLKGLEELNLARNLLSTPSSQLSEGCGGRPDWAHLGTLKKLDLSGNAWTEIPPMVFDGGLLALNKLRIEEASQLREIKADAFKGLPNLKRLSLAKSAFLARIDPAAFDEDMEGLEELDLDNCQMSTLNEDMLDWTTLKRLKLEGNPWNCNCALVTFLPKLLLDGQIRTEVLCAEPEDVRNQNILVVAKNFSSSCASPSLLYNVLRNRPFLWLASIGVVLFLISLIAQITCAICGRKKRRSGIFGSDFCGICPRGKCSNKGGSTSSTGPKPIFIPGSSSCTESLIAYDPGMHNKSARIGQTLKNSTGSSSQRHSNTYSSNDADEYYYSSIGPVAQEERREPPASPPPPPPPPPYFASQNGQPFPPFNLNLAPNLYGMQMACQVAVPPYQLRGSRDTARRNEMRPPSILAPPPPQRTTNY